MNTSTEIQRNYPYCVVPFDKENEIKSKQNGIPATFCASIKIAENVTERLNKYSGILWKIRPTTNCDKIIW